EREMAEMVGGELELAALGRVLLGSGHNACVVDKDVELTHPTCDELAHRCEVGQVEPLGPHFGIPRLRPDREHGAVCGMRVARRDGDVGTCCGERPGSLATEPAAAAGDNG